MTVCPLSYLKKSICTFPTNNNTIIATLFSGMYNVSEIYKTVTYWNGYSAVD